MLLPIFIPDGQGNAGRNRSSLFMTLFFIFFFVMPLFRNDISDTTAKDRLAEPEIIRLSNDSSPSNQDGKFVIQLFPVLDGKQTARKSMSAFLVKGTARTYEIVPGQAEVAEASVLHVRATSTGPNRQNEISFHCRSIHACGYLEGKILYHDLYALSSAASNYIRRIHGQAQLDSARAYFRAHEQHLTTLVHNYRSKKTDSAASPSMMDYLDIIYEYFEGIVQGAAMLQDADSEEISINISDLFFMNAFASGELATVAASFKSKETRGKAFETFARGAEKATRVNEIFQAIFRHGIVGETLQVLKPTYSTDNIATTWTQTRWVPAEVHDLRIVRTMTLELTDAARRLSDPKLARFVLHSITLPGCFALPFSLMSVRSEAVRGSSDFAVVFQNPPILDETILDSIPKAPIPGDTPEASATMLFFLKASVANLAARDATHWSYMFYTMNNPSTTNAVHIPDEETARGPLASWKASSSGIPETLAAQITVADLKFTSQGHWMSIELLPGAYKIENITESIKTNGYQVIGTSFMDKKLLELSGVGRLEEIVPQDLYLHEREFIQRVYGNEAGRDTTDASLLMRRAYRDGVIEKALGVLAESGLKLNRVEDRVDIKK